MIVETALLNLFFPDSVQRVHVVFQPGPLPRRVGDHGGVEGRLFAQVVAGQWQHDIQFVGEGVAEDHVLQRAARTLVRLQEDHLPLGRALFVSAGAARGAE